MFSWLKSFFTSPKKFIKLAVDSLDMFVPYLSIEIDKIKEKFNKMSSQEQSQWLIDQVQAFLTRQFKLDA